MREKKEIMKTGGELVSLEGQLLKRTEKRPKTDLNAPKEKRFPYLTCSSRSAHPNHTFRSDSAASRGLQTSICVICFMPAAQKILG